jgi:crotonobetainyl-CoA:carnitine CoA-transferase CaiB-like acyl-CoA transferase
LADLGADVIKIESPEGDDTRIWRPLFTERGGDKAAAYFHGANKGKTSVAIDLKDPEDLARLKSMITGADILVENVKIWGPDKVWPRLRQIARSAPRLRLLLSYRLRPRRALCLPLGL